MARRCQSMDVGGNDREHPNSNPASNTLPARGQLNDFEAFAKLGMFSPGTRLDRPFDDKVHARRPSDEGERILRKISASGMPSFDIGTLSPRHPSFPSDTPNDMGSMMRSSDNVLGLADTGRMISSALSDSFLPGIGMDDSSHFQSLSPQASMSVEQSEVNNRAVYTPEDHLFPPLSRQDRHPSAPLLHSMLTSGISNTTTPIHSPQGSNLLSPVDTKDILMGELDVIGQRARSSSVPSRAYLPPQISISSPDDLFSPLDRPVSIGESTCSGDNYSFQDYPRSPVDGSLQKFFIQTQLPADPREWTEGQVLQWAQWIIKEYQLLINIQLFQGISGLQLCSFTSHQFHGIAKDYGVTLHSFVERLKAPLQANIFGGYPPFPSTDLFSDGFFYPNMTSEIPSTSSISSPLAGPPSISISSEVKPFTDGMMSLGGLAPNGGGHLLPPPPPYRPGSPSGSDLSSPYTSPAPSPGPSPLHSPIPSPGSSPCVSPTPIRANPNPNSGPIQLWQFLLELLTDRDCQNCIAWTGREWEFKLIDPEEVARRWGGRKNKPKMNYEKLSRGLRYYYDKNIIHKVPGKRYVYRFVCDVESMLGMSFAELQQQLKGDGCDVSKPIKIERHRTASPMVGLGGGMMFPSPTNYGYSAPDMTGLYINPNSPYGMSPLSTSPVQMGGYMQQ